MVPTIAGPRIWTRSVALTWPGVNPMAFITPMSRYVDSTIPLMTFAIENIAASRAKRANARRTGT